jgi:hypothetical protein
VCGGCHSSCTSEKDPICRFRKIMPLCYLGAATDGKNFRPYPALPFSRPLQSKIVFPVSHPNLAFLDQFDFFQLVLVPIMHEILPTER